MAVVAEVAGKEGRQEAAAAADKPKPSSSHLPGLQDLKGTWSGTVEAFGGSSTSNGSGSGSSSDGGSSSGWRSRIRVFHEQIVYISVK